MAARPLHSKVSVKSQTVLPREVREVLDVKPGDRLRYVIDRGVVTLEKASPVGSGDDPFTTFTEWADVDDDAAFADL